MTDNRDIYSAPELYDALHWWKDNDIEFISSWVESVGGPVLELAAGTGRLGKKILERGLEYTGVELSSEYAALARKKLRGYGDRAAIFEDDMRSFRLEKKFKSIFIGFNSFLHLYTDSDALACLQTIRDHLADDGRLLLDMLVPAPWFLNRPKNRLYELTEFEHPDGGICMLKEAGDYDPVTEINHVSWYLFRAGQEKPVLYEFEMRMYFPDTMDRLLDEAGLAIIEKYGDREGNPLNENSDLQIYICGK